MTQSITGAVQAQKSSAVALIQERKVDFFQVLPSQVRNETWIRLAQSSVNKNPALKQHAERNPSQLMQALLECARLGHEPGTDRGYLMVFKGKIEYLESYKGIIQRIIRNGNVRKVVAETVHENDGWAFDSNHDERPHHTVQYSDADRGAPKFSYAYVVYTDGSTSTVAVADEQQIAKVRSEQPNSKSASSPWVKWTSAMYRKCAVKLLEPYVETSSEDRRNRVTTEVERVVVDSDGAEVIDGEILNGDGPEYTEPEYADIEDAEVTDVSGMVVVEEIPND